jgi:6-phosphofructokinase 1
MVQFLIDNKINILFTIGGDGTLHGASEMADEAERRGLKVSIIGVPKTIDNDILFTSRTFGFETAVELSQGAIRVIFLFFLPKKKKSKEKRVSHS